MGHSPQRPGAETASTNAPSPLSNPYFRGPHLLPASPSAPFYACASGPTWDPSKLAALREWPRPPTWSRFLIGCPSLARAKFGRLVTAPLTALPLESCATTSSLSPPPLAHWYSCNQLCRHVSGITRAQPGCESEAGREAGAGTMLQAEPRKVFPFSAPLFLLDPCPALTLKRAL